MGFKDKMMEGMMNGMSAEEKKEMMDKMMESFFAGMSDEEKQEMMKDMMNKMMGQSSGEGGMTNMVMGMIGGRGAGGKGFNPMDMCRSMMGSFQETAASAKFATPEVRTLFDEWAVQIEEEIYAFIQTGNEINPDKIAEHFKLSKESVIYFLKRLAEKGKIKFGL